MLDERGAELKESDPELAKKLLAVELGREGDLVSCPNMLIPQLFR